MSQSLQATKRGHNRKISVVLLELRTSLDSLDISLHSVAH
jgi:hypothetical protein